LELRTVSVNATRLTTLATFVVARTKIALAHPLPGAAHPRDGKPALVCGEPEIRIILEQRAERPPERVRKPV
jgi:hypothetical protein